jgi:hypothetical protein
LQLAPRIDKAESDLLWMTDFETLENLSGTFWSNPDAGHFDALCAKQEASRSPQQDCSTEMTFLLILLILHLI